MPAANWYGLPVRDMYDGSAVIDWNTDTIKVALTTSAYTPNKDTHDRFNDVTNEVTGTGYTAGGVTLTTPTVTYDTATDEIRLDADDPAWASSSITARNAVWYKDTGTASTSPLIGYLEFGADVTTSSGTLTIACDSTGHYKLDAT
jgi:hypothetical protein